MKRADGDGVVEGAERGELQQRTDNGHSQESETTVVCSCLCIRCACSITAVSRPSLPAFSAAIARFSKHLSSFAKATKLMSTK